MLLCGTVLCDSPAEFMVTVRTSRHPPTYWPGQAIRMCAPCATRAEVMADHLGKFEAIATKLPPDFPANRGDKSPEALIRKARGD